MLEVPEQPEVLVEPGDADDPRTFVEIRGEPGSEYELVVESETQRRSGSIPEGGSVSIRLLVENGDHTATAHLVGPSGQESETTVAEFEVDVPPPAEPRVSVHVEDDSTVLVEVQDGPPFGAVEIELADESVVVETSESGQGEQRVTLEPGDYEGVALARDFQRQRSDPVRLASFTIGGDEDDGSLVGGLIVVALLAASGIYVWRRRRSPTRPPDSPPPPPPAPAGGGPGPPLPPMGSAHRW